MSGGRVLTCAAAALIAWSSAASAVAGDLDVPPILTIADALQAGIPGAEKRILPGRSHHPNLEDPRAFNGLLLDFLLRVLPRSS